MASNRGVAYIKPGVVEVHTIPYPKLRMPKSETDPFGGKDAPHGVILKIITTNICGSDQHMVRGPLVTNALWSSLRSASESSTT
jgi:glutathione-independent formaldehyde dehydrogenase